MAYRKQHVDKSIDKVVDPLDLEIGDVLVWDKNGFYEVAGRVSSKPYLTDDAGMVRVDTEEGKYYYMGGEKATKRVTPPSPRLH